MLARPLAVESVAPTSPLNETMMSRLSRALGPQKGNSLASAILATMGIPILETPQDLCDFSNHLIGYGGLAEAVGRSLKVMALLRSAIDRPISARKDGIRTA